ncbi:MAG: peptidyl-prolyl cis-trans isomerase [Spirochaetaceae bacterium]|jgi:parvulin-like peptidyl-prolyl isomerase|nr:peptidyl-prolyl cis-trans isomerase [Spirochaetaceae bacterium]
MSPKNNLVSPFSKTKKGTSLLKYLVLTLLLVLVIVAFIVSPALGQSSKSGVSGVFGKFATESIRYSQGNYFYNQVASLNNMYRETMSENPELFEAYRRNIWNSAFSETVSYAAKKYYMKDAGYAISGFYLDKAVIESGYYASEDETFDERRYAESTNADRERIRNLIQNQQLLQQFRNDYIMGVKISQNQLDFIGQISPDERKIQYVVFTGNDYPDNLVIDVAKENGEFFQSRDLSRMTFDSEKAAQDAMKELEELNFTEVATQYSRDTYAEQGGSMGSQYFYSLVQYLDEEMAADIFSLSVGQNTQPLETAYGWIIYKADSEIKDADFEDEAMLSSLRSWVKFNKGDIITQWNKDRATEFISESQRFSENNFTNTAILENLEVKESDYFPLNWGSSPLLGSSISSAVQDYTLQSASKSDEFYREIFTLDIGEISEPITLGDSLVVVKLMDTREPESQVSSIYVENYMMRYREQLWKNMAMDSELFNNNFEANYSDMFKSTGNTQS